MKAHCENLEVSVDRVHAVPMGRRVIGPKVKVVRLTMTIRQDALFADLDEENARKILGVVNDACINAFGKPIGYPGQRGTLLEGEPLPVKPVIGQ